MLTKRASTQIAIIGAVSAVLASVFASWGTSSVKTAVIEERENNHYAEVQKGQETIRSDQQEMRKEINDMSKKLDTVLLELRQGGSFVSAKKLNLGY